MSATDADLKALRAELAQLRKDFSRIAETLEHTARHGGEEVMSHVRESAEDLRDEAAKAVRGVREEFEHKPISSLVTIFAVGVILGLLFSSRR
ncbi:MAG: hypothetical protein U1E87_05555 [Alphaproteobacteria bacterium]